jgi:hypothetical protein
MIPLFENIQKLYKFENFMKINLDIVNDVIYKHVKFEYGEPRHSPDGWEVVIPTLPARS